MGDTLSALSLGPSPVSSVFENLQSRDALTLSSANSPMSSITIGASLGAEDEGSRPVWDRLVDIPTKFVPLTGAAIFNSFANTAIDAGNFFGADWKRFKIEDEFGPDSATTKYYQANSGVVEGAALAIGSLAPGLAGIKVLKMAQAGSFGASFQTATGLFSGMRAGALAEANAAAVGNVTGTSLFGQTQLQTVKALAAGFGDNALQGAAYEIATLATMHASPIYDGNSLLDNVKDVATSALAFGAFGGIIDGAKAYVQIRKSVMAGDISTKAFDLVAAKGIGNITPGDRITALYQGLDEIPEATTRLGKMKSQATENVTQRLIRQQFLEASGGDVDVAAAMHTFVEKGRAEGLLTTEGLVDQVGSLVKLGRYDGVDIASRSKDVFHINSKIDPNDIYNTGLEDLFSKTPENEITSKSYMLTNPKNQPTIAKASDTLYIPSSRPGQNEFISISKYKDPADAFKQGADIFVDAAGKVHVNETSKAIREVPQAGKIGSIFSGKLNVWHSTSEEGALSFRNPSTVESRYGGVLGDNGVYLDETGDWSWAATKDITGFHGKYSHEVEVNFRKAFVLTPETAKKLGGSGSKPLGGEEITALLKNDGYDGIILRGWEKERERLEKLATAKDYSGAPAFPRGMFPELDKLSDDMWRMAPAAGSEKFIGTAPGSHLYPELMSLKHGIDPAITQDQIFAFYPETLTVGKALSPEEARAAYPRTPKPINITDSLPHSRILSPEERAFYQENGKLPPGSAPLQGIGTTLDLQTGKIYRDSAPPAVIGDLGKPKLVGSSTLEVGDRNFTYSLGQPFDVAAATSLEANSRYVWASMRGLKKNDIVHSTDLPWLEQAYRELQKSPDAISKLGADTFSDGVAIPKTADGMLELIAAKKQDLYVDLLEAGKNADEISRILNAPTKGMTKNFNTQVPEELMFSPESSSNIRHVRLAYDIGTIRNDEGNLLFGMQGMQYRMKVAQDTNTNTFSNWVGKTVAKAGLGADFGERFLGALKLDADASGANILGSGNGYFRNANADYATFGQRTERAGKAVAEITAIQRSSLSDTLLPSVNRFRADTSAHAEFGNLQAVAHSSGEHWHLYPDEQLAAWGLPKNTLVLESAVSTAKDTGQLIWNPDHLPNGFVKGTILPEGQTTAKNGPRIAATGPTNVSLQSLYTISDVTADLLRTHREITNERNAFRNDWWNSQGLSKPIFPAERVYFPPINTSNYPYFAYVKQRDGLALGESGASIVTAKTAEDLQKKIAALGPEYDAFTKGDIAAFKKANGEYLWDRNFANSQVKTEMARKGILNNIVPETRGANLIDDLVSWHFRQTDMLTRDMVELYNAPTFAQLTAMGDRWAQTGTTRFGAVTPFVEKSARNPYNSYIRTALGLGAKDDYPIWQLAQDKLQSYGDTAFNAVRDAFGAAKKGILPWEEASKVSERFGLGNPYGTALDELSKANYYGGLSNQLPEGKLLSKYVGVSNTTLGATTVRLDAFQQLIDATTFPILSALEYLPATRDLRALMNVTVPGAAGATQTEAPGFTRVMYNAIRNFWKDDGTLAKLYTQAGGLTRDELHTYRSMIDDLTLPLGKLSQEGWTQKIEGAVSKAETLVGTKFTNRFLHFLASDIGRQMGEAAGQSGRELYDTIGTFTNRVLGTSAANQRAAIFTGPVGQALGLFQSFNWNVMQQLLRHVGEGDTKAIAVAAGLQSSIFGVSTLPGFAQMNKLIAERHGNETGADTFSGLTGLLGKPTADYLLYGSLSSLLGTSFYDRGDLNPRRLTVLPTNPLEFPSVAAGIRVYQNLAQLGNNLTQGAGSPIASVMLAAEHNGLSRPLTGLVQLAQGYSTDNSGRMVSANSGLNDMYNISNLSRLLGAKPLDEAIAGDALRRIQAVQVKDTARLADLGRAAMTSLYAGSSLSSEQTQQLLADYAKAGGNQENFNGWFLDKVRNANIPVANQVMNNFHNPRNQVLMKILGGVPLPSVVGNVDTGTPLQ